MNARYEPKHTDEANHSETVEAMANHLSKNSAMRHFCGVIFTLMALVIAFVYYHFAGPEILNLIS